MKPTFIHPLMNFIHNILFSDCCEQKEFMYIKIRTLKKKYNLLKEKIGGVK